MKSIHEVIMVRPRMKKGVQFLVAKVKSKFADVMIENTLSNNIHSIFYAAYIIQYIIYIYIYIYIYLYIYICIYIKIVVLTHASTSLSILNGSIRLK